jgi:hypothetical protein
MLQTIVGALAAGVAAFFVVVVLVAGRDQRIVPPGQPLIANIAVGVTIAIFAAWAFVPNIIAGKMRQSIVEDKKPHPAARLSGGAGLGDIGPLSAAYQTRLIIGAALLEGAAFFNLVAYLLERQSLSLIAAGVLLLVILSQIPTVSRLEEWTERELATIEQMRQMGRGNV